MNIKKSIAELVGNTPLVELSNFDRNHGLEATIAAKVEFVNPAGSVKDRVALAMIEDALANGTIDGNTVLIEPTSGNTGIGLAAIAATRGLRLILVMPDTMSVERQKLAQAYGAEIVLTEGAKGMKGSIEKADELAEELGNALVVGQFVNPANPAIHEATTGPEIWEDTEGGVDYFVAGVGTGGTLTGVGRYLKAQNPAVKVIAVEPSDSPVLSKGESGSHKLQGIGAGFVPDTLDTSVYDEVITIESEEAYEAARELACGEGLLVGISSGAAVAAARKIAERPGNEGKLIVALIPDTGERYLSTELFA